jgi:hypothetical protein
LASAIPVILATRRRQEFVVGVTRVTQVTRTGLFFVIGPAVGNRGNERHEAAFGSSIY